MGGTTLHAGIVAQWFEMLLLVLFKRYANMIINGILFGVMQPITFPVNVKSIIYCFPPLLKMHPILILFFNRCHCSFLLF